MTKDPNKLGVYLPVNIYKITVNGKDYFMGEDEELMYDGKVVKVKDLKNLLK